MVSGNIRSILVVLVLWESPKIWENLKNAKREISKKGTFRVKEIHEMEKCQIPQILRRILFIISIDLNIV